MAVAYGLDHVVPHDAVRAERGLLGALGCGSQCPPARTPRWKAESIGRTLGADLLGRGARRILDAVYAG